MSVMEQNQELYRISSLTSRQTKEAFDDLALRLKRLRVRAAHRPVAAQAILTVAVEYFLALPPGEQERAVVAFLPVHAERMRISYELGELASREASGELRDVTDRIKVLGGSAQHGRQSATKQRKSK